MLRTECLGICGRIEEMGKFSLEGKRMMGREKSQGPGWPTGIMAARGQRGWRAERKFESGLVLGNRLLLG